MKIPDGYFVNDLIIFNEPDKRGWAAKGFIIETPDFRNASIQIRNEYHNKLTIFLSSVQKPLNVQFSWNVDSDYKRELLSYDAATDKLAKNEWTRLARKERFNRYWEKMTNRKLRRERLNLYLSMPINTNPPAISSQEDLEKHYRNLFEALNMQFNNQIQSFKNMIGGYGVKITPMTDKEHFREYAYYFNPSFKSRFDFDPADNFNPSLSILENSWLSGVQGNFRKADNDYGFFMDGYYHNILVLNRWPQNTYPGIISHLTSLPILDYSITMNIYPLSVENEIKKEEQDVSRLTGDIQAEKKYSLITARDKKLKKIDALARGFTYPFKALTVIHVWSLTKEELPAKMSAVKSAINLMDMATYWEANLPTTTQNLFFMAAPGWTFGKYTGHAIYAENQYLADLLPISATFTGLLDDAEAIYDGSTFNIVGIKNFIQGTPQHCAVFGMSGAGKSALMQDLLSQTECFYDYTCIIEEGLSYGVYTQTMGSTPFIIHPDSGFTINYLDTQGLPLTALHLATATAIVSKMCGRVKDEDKQNLRSSQIMQYIDQLYTDSYADWIRNHENLLPEIAKKAYCVKHVKDKMMAPGCTTIDAYIEFRDMLKNNDERIMQLISGITDEQVTRVLTSSESQKLVRDIAFTYFTHEEYPTHSTLQELMLISPFAEHNKDEIKHLSTLLTAWSNYGSHGVIFDGVTNINLTDKIAHFELGSIPEAAEELKKMVGFVIDNYIRNHIMTMPRSARKRYVFEEAGRLLAIDGGEKIISEGYAQMRKFNTWIVSIVQQYSRFKQTSIRPVIIGNSKQFFLMRQNDRSDLADISKDINLSSITQENVMNYPNPETLPPGRKFSSFTYYNIDSQNPVCGTARNYCSPEMLYCSSSGGEHFEERIREMKQSQENNIVDVIKKITKKGEGVS